MKGLIVFAIFFSFASSSCHFLGHRIYGNGNVVSESRSFSGFNGVEVSSAIHLYMKQDSSFAVKVETDENLQQYVIITQDNGVLRVRQERNTNLDPTGSIKVYVSAPTFDYLKVSGASKIKGENKLLSAESIDIDASGASDITLDLKAPGVRAELSGASSMRLSGETKDLKMSGSGASHFRCFDLLSENAHVDISGASHADVFASVKLEAEASGASDVRFKGVTNYTGHTSGAGSIKKVD